MIEEQSFLILDLNDKIKQTDSMKKFDSKHQAVITEDKQEPVQKVEAADTKAKTNKASHNGKHYSELYIKASEKKHSDADVIASDNDYEDIVEDDDDNDSFITINTDDETDEESDATIENSQSSDSGYNDYHDSSPVNGPQYLTNSSYGVNPMFARADGTESCQDFVYFNRGTEIKLTFLHNSFFAGKELQTIPEKEVVKSAEQKKDLRKGDIAWSGSLKRTHKIVIINNESALVCNESCLI